MISQVPPRLWKHVFKESIWGNRGFIKISALLLPLSIIFALQASEIGPDTVFIFFAVVLTVSAWLLVSILANDLADARDDRVSGKSRWINRLPPLLGRIIILFLFGLGLSPMLYYQSPVTAVWGYMLAMGIGLLYSFKPARLKEQGMWGLAAYSLSCALGYVVIPWTWLSAPAGWLLLLVPAVFFDKWTNLHFHQVIDFSSDLQGGVKTYAVQAGLERSRRTLKWASGLASLMLIAVLIAVVQVLPASWRVITLCFVGGVILGSAVYAVIAQRNSLGVTSLSRELSWLYLGLTYAVFRILPLILLMRLSLTDPRMAAATAFAILILLIESRFFLCYRYE